MDDIKLLTGFFTTPCDKCQGEVAINDDVVALLVLETGNREYGMKTSRHILPVKKDGKIICEGSPSRAQYLEGQGPNTRSAHIYRAENEAPMRALYARLQEVAPALESANG